MRYRYLRELEKADKSLQDMEDEIDRLRKMAESIKKQYAAPDENKTEVKGGNHADRC